VPEDVTSELRGDGVEVVFDDWVVDLTEENGTSEDTHKTSHTTKTT